MDQETLTELVKPSIDYVRHKKFRSGNYPSSLSNETDRLVHWCHGAPGVIHMLMQAYKVSPSVFIDFTEYSGLEGTHNDHRVQPLSLWSEQGSNPQPWCN